MEKRFLFSELVTNCSINNTGHLGLSDNIIDIILDMAEVNGSLSIKNNGCQLDKNE